MAYESYCWQCRVTHPPGTRRCLHCGGPVHDERPDSSSRLVTQSGPSMTEAPGQPLEDSEPADGRPQPPRGMRIAVTALWVLLAVAASLYRACTSGG